MSIAFRILLFAAICLVSTPLFAASALRTVALTGQHAPGTPEGVEFSLLANSYGPIPLGPVINNAGKTAFFGGLDGPGVTNSNAGGVWSEGHGELDLVLRNGTALTNFNGSIASINSSGASINTAGDVIFHGRLDGQDGELFHDYGIMTNKSGTLSFLAQNSVPPPGAKLGETFGTFYPPTVSSYATTFRAQLDNCVNSCSGIWSARPDALDLIVRAGDQAPGTALGQKFVGFHNFASNSNGDVAFIAFLDGGNNQTPFDDSGVWTEKDGILQLAFDSSDLTQANGGISTSNIKELSVNSFGEIAVQTDSGVWESSSGSLRLVAGIVGSAPEISKISRFESINGPLFNSAGNVAFAGLFVATADDPSSGYGIWAEDESGLNLVARAGDQAPGAPEGSNFNFMSFSAFNAHGQTAFNASLTGEHIGNGVWATDRSGTLHPIVVSGDDLEVAPGEFRTVLSAYFQSYSGNDDGRPSGFNDRGQIVYVASFTDGSQGIFLSNAVAVPEPGTWLLGFSLTSLLSMGRYRRANLTAVESQDRLVFHRSSVFG